MLDYFIYILHIFKIIYIHNNNCPDDYIYIYKYIYIYILIYIYIYKLERRKRKGDEQNRPFTK